MIAVTLVEDLGIGAACIFAITFVFATWRGIKIIIIRKDNGNGD